MQPVGTMPTTWSRGTHQAALTLWHPHFGLSVGVDMCVPTASICTCIFTAGRSAIAAAAAVSWQGLRAVGHGALCLGDQGRVAL
jgi:hypothetical protein